jgi:HAD superfamily phosphatase
VKDLLVFDMEGVLVDVSDSYRETIQQTVRFFTGQEVTRERIQDYKNQGGFNDDWKLSYQVIQDQGFHVDFDTMVARFQEIFHGANGDGLIRRERWIPLDGLLERLAAKNTLAIFTGRLHWEAVVTLDRFRANCFEIVGVDDVKNAKPAADGLLQLRAAHPEGNIRYLGDTVDDARSAQAAGVPFIGVAPAGTPERPRLIELLRAEGAIEVIENVNELESIGI